MRILALPLALLVAASPIAAQQKGGWTTAWTASMWQATGQNLLTVANVTIRAGMRVGAGGSALRLRLSNEHGDAAVRIGAVTVKAADGRMVRATFGGSTTARIAAGAPLISDPINLPVKAFEVVEVSIYLPDSTALSSAHGAGGAPTAISAAGDHSGEASFAAASTTRNRPLIAGIDVLGTRARPVIVAYGDSITDNTGCANDAPVVCRWGDVLGRRLAKAGKPHVVVTQAISGNRILTTGSGPNALARFDRDVLATPGISHVVLLEGINDIGSSGPENPITADDLIAAFRQLIARAHGRGIKVFASPILPWKGASRFTPEREAIRVAVNRWIRTSREVDAVIDLEKSVADPADPLRLATALQTGDNLHPNGEGETAMGNAVPLGLFR